MMLRRLLGICLLVTAYVPGSLAQRGATPPQLPPWVSQLYVDIGAGGSFTPASLGCPGAGVNFLLQSGWGGSISARGVIYKAEATPAGYKSDCLLGGDCTPRDNVMMLDFRTMRVWQTANSRIRLGLEAGPSIVRYTIYHFAVDTTSHGFLYFGNGYVESSNADVTLGLAVRAKLQIEATRNLGFELAALTNLNNLRNVALLEARIVFGRLRLKAETNHPYNAVRRNKRAADYMSR